jgi:protein dithiol:quinone oxidoreductase
MLDLLGTRLAFAAIALGCATLLGIGYYLQFADGLEPCPMCIFQRVCYMAVTALALVATLHGPGPTGQRVYSVLLGLPAVAGLGVASRQTWLQHLPADQVPECGPGLSFMLEMYAPFEVLKRTLRGTGDCAEVDWTFLGLSIAEWSVICFTSLLILLVAQFIRARPANPVREDQR